MAIKNATPLYSETSTTMLIFTYAPTGLGHLRVTDALHDSMPFHSKAVLLGAQDKKITYIHRLMSSSKIGRFIFEWFQNGVGEQVFVNLYRNFLRRNTDTLLKQILTLIDQQYSLPKKVVCICTHFSLAHQLAEIKRQVEHERSVEFNVIVQVTDDSPQGIWYIQGADLITVPSYKTKTKLAHYGKIQGLKKTNMTVLPYPLSPLLTKHYTMTEFQRRASQYNPQSKAKIHVSVPVSGAAVGLNYLADLITTLHSISDRFIFHIVSKKAQYTETFLKNMERRAYINIYSSEIDRDVVNAYEQMYRDTCISFEVTKPSEQAFKTLISPRQVGGSILLFTDPVGKQEYDNLDFMQRNRLIPVDTINNKVEYSCYRGLRLLTEPTESAKLIHELLLKNHFFNMSECQMRFNKTDEQKDEIGWNGAERFWQSIKEFT